MKLRNLTLSLIGLSLVAAAAGAGASPMTTAPRTIAAMVRQHEPERLGCHKMTPSMG